MTKKSFKRKLRKRSQPATVTRKDADRKPDLRQLSNFAAVLCFGPGATERQRELVKLTLENNEWLRERWLAKHRESQAGLASLGD